MKNMKKIAIVLLICCFLVGTVGCTIVQSPAMGMFYTKVKAPLGATSNSGASKIGKASIKTYVGLIAVGDASIQTAAANGGITKIHHVDYESESILGVVGTFTTIVYGE